MLMTNTEYDQVEIDLEVNIFSLLAWWELIMLLFTLTNEKWETNISETRESMEKEWDLKIARKYFQ